MVIRIFKNSTTVNSTTNDEINWEFSSITSSATKTAKKPTKKRKTKRVSPVIIKERKTCFRCGIVGHKISKCFFFARRPMVTAVIITKTTIPGTTIKKIHSKFITKYGLEYMKIIFRNMQ